MVEIKSTLDLVMERTRHLSLSAEEKAQQQREEFQKRLQGLLQQYADDAVSMDELPNRLTALQDEFSVTEGRVPAAVLGRIDPDQENTRWLDLLVVLAPEVIAHLREVLAIYAESRKELLEGSLQNWRQRLAEDYGISGSAVVPNTQKDPQFQAGLAALRREVQKEIDQLAQRAA
jgi:hypothetical protein